MNVEKYNYDLIERETAKVLEDYFKNYKDYINEGEVPLTTARLREIVQSKLGKKETPSLPVFKKLRLKAENKYLRYDVRFVDPICRDLGKVLEEKFALKKENAIVIDSSTIGLEKKSLISSMGRGAGDVISEESLVSVLGKMASEYFIENVKEGCEVVISCGSTINAMISNLDDEIKYNDLTALSSIVLCVDQFEQLSPPALINNLCNRVDGVKGVYFQFPSQLVRYTGGCKEISKMLNESLFKRAEKADFFFLGIGSLSTQYKSSASGGFNYLVDQLECYKALKDHGCCGEVSYCPIRRTTDNRETPWIVESLKDRSVPDKLNNFIRQVHCFDFNKFILDRRDAQEGEKKSTVVAVAGGPGKAEAIFTCLKMGGFIDVLITDSDTAKKILEID